jgi:hypothetical protein
MLQVGPVFADVDLQQALAAIVELTAMKIGDQSPAMQNAIVRAAAQSILAKAHMLAELRRRRQ